jgi:pimeloyl-ACP methyl ester carboxylesterase
VLFGTGILVDYYGHPIAHVWRTPGVGELSMAWTDRSLFHSAMQNGQTKPLPRDFVDRLYDDFDRMTRCSVLRLYRSFDDPDGTGNRQAERLRPRDIPALVIWGEDDPYLPASLAERQREAFPHARIVMYEDSAHWPFIDYPRRAARDVVPFLREQFAR